MSCYLDTSALVATLVTEKHTDRVMAWFIRQPIGTLFISEWTIPEVASALSLKLRTGQLTIDQRAAALSTWSRLRGATLHTLGIASEHFEAAAGFANQYQLGVRGGDALHLAVAATSGFRLVTLDATMARAAPLLGVPVEPLDLPADR